MTEVYEKAKHLGERAFRKALSSGQYPYLPDLDGILPQKDGNREVRVGTMEIPLEMIIGTKSRSRGESFAVNYMPLLDSNSEFAAKWKALYETQLEEGIRDAVNVYEYLHRFYVLEGNKRVSVLRFLKAPLIRAEVIRILPVKSDDPEARLYEEFLDFFSRAPLYELTFSEPGSYRKLEKLTGMDGKTPWPEERLRRVKSAYYSFREAYEKKTHFFTNTADVFLVFLEYFPVNILLEQSTSAVGRLIGKEFRQMRQHNENTRRFR